MDRREVNRWIEEQRHYFKLREESIEISVEELRGCKEFCV